MEKDEDGRKMMRRDHFQIGSSFSSLLFPSVINLFIYIRGKGSKRVDEIVREKSEKGKERVSESEKGRKLKEIGE